VKLVARGWGRAQGGMMDVPARISLSLVRSAVLCPSLKLMFHDRNFKKACQCGALFYTDSKLAFSCKNSLKNLVIGYFPVLIHCSVIGIAHKLVFKNSIQENVKKFLQTLSTFVIQYVCTYVYDRKKNLAKLTIEGAIYNIRKIERCANVIIIHQ